MNFFKSLMQTVSSKTQKENGWMYLRVPIRCQSPEEKQNVILSTTKLLERKIKIKTK